MTKVFGQENNNSNFHNFFLEVENNLYMFLNLRHLYLSDCGGVNFSNSTIQLFQYKKFQQYLCSAAASGWAGWALVHPEFGSSVNPITTRGADYVHHITASPPGFENPAAALQSVW